MPSMTDFVNAETAVVREFVERGERRRQKSLELLPADFCGAVVLNARAAAERIIAWRDKYQTELDGQCAVLKAAQADVRAKYGSIAARPRAIGDVLLGPQRIVVGPSTAGMRTGDAIALERARVLPVRDHIRWCERQIYACETSLAKLRQIIKRAEAGSVSLLTYMTSEWREVLLVGEAHIGRLPPPVRGLLRAEAQPTDLTGEPLPVEAMAEDGKTPDLAPGMRGSIVTVGGEPGNFPHVPAHIPPAMQRRNEEIARRRAAGESMPSAGEAARRLAAGGD